MSVVDSWATIHTNQYGSFGIKKIEKNISDLKSVLKPGDSILDAGCGRGELWPYLHQVEYLGIDAYQERIDEARKLHPGASFSRCDLFDMKTAFDVIWCARVIIHLKDYERAIKHLKSLAKKLVLVVEIGKDAVTEDKGVHFRTFSRKTLEKFGECQIIERPQLTYSTVIYG